MDPANHLTSSTDRDNRLITYAYDDVGRDTGETWRDSPGGSVTGYGVFGYDNAGNLTNAYNNAGAYNMSSDADNRMTYVAEPAFATLTMVYDNIGNRLQVQDVFGGVESSTYDVNDNVTSCWFFQSANPSSTSSKRITP